LDLLDPADAAPLAEPRRASAARAKGTNETENLPAEIAKPKFEIGHVKAAVVKQDRDLAEMRAEPAGYKERDHMQLARGIGQGASAVEARVTGARERIVPYINANLDGIADEDRLTFALALEEWIEISKSGARTAIGTAR
jgi:hypothetical protein